MDAEDSAEILGRTKTRMNHSGTSLASRYEFVFFLCKPSSNRKLSYFRKAYRLARPNNRIILSCPGHS